MRAEFRTIGDDEVRSRLDGLAAASGGTIVIRRADQPATRGAEAGRASRQSICLEFHGSIDLHSA